MENDAVIRLSAFLGLLALFAGQETLAPRRKRTQPRSTRWLTNWAIQIIDAVTLRALALALLAVGAAVDAAVRRVLVTPDMHRVHHSTNREEHDSNYGFALSVWNRFLGTYLPQPQAGQDRPGRQGRVLSLPFFRK